MRKLIFIIAIFYSFNVLANDIVVSIKPIHSIVQNITKTRPKLIIENGFSVHGYLLKPSDMKALNDSKIIFYIDDEFETFLAKPLKNLPEGVKKIKLLESSGLDLIEMVDDHEGHGQSYNMHIWLSLKNTKKIAEAISKELSLIFPEKEVSYQQNLQEFVKKLDKKDAKISKKLLNIKDKPYLVFHDAYQYFEKDYSLNNKGAITVDPELPVSINKVKELKRQISKQKIICVFKEPQFSDRMINLLVKDSKVHKGSLDPLGSNLESGEGMYFKLVDNLADGFFNCLQ